jgi:cytochrome c553
MVSPQVPTAEPEWPSVPSHDKGKRLAEDKCAACHGTHGNSTNPQYPKLAGQNPAYLYSQILAFRTGSRRSDAMSGIATVLSDADAADAAS